MNSNQMLVPPTTLTLKTDVLKNLDHLPWNTERLERLVRRSEIRVEPDGRVDRGNLAVWAAIRLGLEHIIVTEVDYV